MKPYYQDEWVTIYHGDCREILPQLPKVDLVLTDPPYGKQWARGINAFGDNPSLSEDYSSLLWDRTRPPKECFDLIREQSSNQIIFGGNYFTDYLPPSNCWLVWDKKGSIGFQNPMSDCELIWTSFNTVVKKYTFIQQGFVSDTKDKRLHPTQKPSELVYRILEDYSGPSDTILDPFLGSGTTAYCAKKLNRKCIGIEIEEKYCEMAANRCRQMVMDLSKYSTRNSGR